MSQDTTTTDTTEAAQSKNPADHLWMHFTRMSSYATNPVPTIERGEGAYIWDTNGKKYLDALSGLFVVQVGHGREELALAAAEQARKLAFFPIWSYAHPKAIELAERLAHEAPGDLNKVFFSTGGAESVETAWKVAKQYFKLIGKPSKTKVISRAIAYHGTTQGALSITGVPGFKHAFEPLVPGTFRVPNTNFYRAPDIYEHDEKQFGLWAANRVEEAILEEGPESIAAVFVEPVQNAGGCFPPPPGYFERLREICDQLRRASGLRRGHLRLRPAGHHVRIAEVRLPARHHHQRQGPHLGLFAAGCGDHLRPGVRAVRSGRRGVPARLHLRRPPGLLRGGPGQPGHLRARGPARQRAAQRERAFARRWRSSTTCRSSATSVATATSTASNWSATRRPRRASTTPTPSGSCAATCRARCSRTVCTAAPTIVATPSSRSLRR